MMGKGGLDICFLDCSQFPDTWTCPKNVWTPGMDVVLGLASKRTVGGAGWKTKTREIRAPRRPKLARNVHKKQPGIGYAGGQSTPSQRGQCDRRPSSPPHQGCLNDTFGPRHPDGVLGRGQPAWTFEGWGIWNPELLSKKRACIALRAC